MTVRKIRAAQVRTKQNRLGIQADDLARAICKLRYGRCCCPCRRCGGRLEWAHIYSRGHHQIRWDEDNAVALCHSCHFFYTNRPIDWQDWLEGFVGVAKLDELRLRQRMRSGQPIDLQLIILSLRQRLKELEDRGEPEWVGPLRAPPPPVT